MNKDFFTKPISLKDIDLKSIDWKNLKNKKEIVIGILILIYIIAIFVIGSKLLNTREEVKTEYLAKETRYNALQRAGSEETIKKLVNIYIERSKEYQCVCKEYNVKFVDTSQNREEVLNDLMLWLKEHNN